MWAKRVWRVIDMREKINLPLYYPTEAIRDRKSLFEVIRQGLLQDGSITAYDPGPLLDDDAFTKPMSKTEVEELLVRMDRVWTEELETGEMIPVPQPRIVESRDINMYRVKEDWIFDKQRSKLDIRIIGIAPMQEKRGDDDEIRGYAPLFWLYYPECRYVLANEEVFIRMNDGQRRSYDELFQKRQFSSYVYKWSNVYD